VVQECAAGLLPITVYPRGCGHPDRRPTDDRPGPAARDREPDGGRLRRSHAPGRRQWSRSTVDTAPGVAGETRDGEASAQYADASSDSGAGWSQ
jgi:hypothetical protein